MTCYAQTAVLIPDKVEMGDIALLILEYKDTFPSLYSIDTSDLEKDFEVLSVKSDLRKQSASEKISHRMRWQIELFPRKTGELRVPPIEINGEWTPELVLRVQSSGQVAGTLDRDVFVEISADPKRPYVGQRTDIVVKLFHNLRIIRSNLLEPKHDNLEMFPNGHEVRYQQTIKGRTYDVQEQTIAVFPRSPGELRIAPASFRGTVDRGAAESSLTSTKRIKRDSNSLLLQVRDVPHQYSGHHWLPAHDLKIRQQWDKSELAVGDSLIRTVTILTDGLPASALPEVSFTEGDGFNVYSDEAIKTTKYLGGKLVGEYKQQYAIIFSDPGDVIIPEIRLVWWDIDGQIERISVAPEQRFSIAEGRPGEKPNYVGTYALPELLDNSREAFPFATRVGRWSAFLALFFIVVFCVWIKIRGANTNERPEGQPTRWFIRRSLKRACQQDDGQTARTQLIAWATRETGKSFIGLRGIVHSAKTREFKKQLAELDAALYSCADEPWKGDALWHAFVSERLAIKKTATSTISSLQPLYSSPTATEC